MGAGSGPGAGSLDGSLPSDSREALIDAALKLFAHQGYEVTTASQIAAEAGVPEADFVAHFATPESVLVSISDDMARATGAELNSVARGTDPMRALLHAATSALGAIVDGRSELTLDRLLAMARIVTKTRNLQRKVSAGRKRVLNRPLADWMGVEPEDRRVQHVLTLWSAVAASAYVSALALPDGYTPVPDAETRRTIVADFLKSFGDVTGEEPDQVE